MTTTSDTLRARAVQTMEADRIALGRKVAELEERDRVAVKDAEKASAAYHRLADKDKTMAFEMKDGGKKVPTKLGLAFRNMIAKLNQVEGIGKALSRARTELSLLDDAAEVDRRVSVLQNPRRSSGGGTRQGGSPRMAADMKQVPKATLAKIVKMIEEGRGAPYIATKLNEEGLKDPAGKEWNHGKVRAAVRASGTEWNDIRAKHKPASKPRSRSNASEAPAKRRSGSASSSGAARKPSGDVEPLPKSKQASGTSRGGSGSRKASKQASAKAASKPRSTTQASSASRGKRRSGTVARKPSSKKK